VAKHQFNVALLDDNGVVVGAQCTKCGRVVMYENGKISPDIREQECKPMSDRI
jgi:uncharacterized OB-fold protein